VVPVQHRDHHDRISATSETYAAIGGESAAEKKSAAAYLTNALVCDAENAGPGYLEKWIAAHGKFFAPQLPG